MAQAGAIRAGKAYVEVHGEDSGLKKTLKGNEGATKAWGAKIAAIAQSVGSTFAKGLTVVSQTSLKVAGVGATALGLFGAAAKSFVDNADRLSRLPKTGISNEDLKAARTLKLSMSTLATSLQVAWAQIGAAVAPVLTKLLNGISIVVQGVSKWMSKNRPLIADIAVLIAKATAFAACLFVAAKVALIVGAGIALIANPVGILAALLVAGVASWAAWSTSGQQSVGYVRSVFGETITWLQERFGQLFKDFQQTWSGIVAAVGKGDLALAAEIAWTGLKVTFFEAIKAMGGNWNKFYTTYLNTVALIGDAWDVLWTRLKQGWRSTQNFLSKGIAILLGALEGKSAAERQQVLDLLDQDTTKDNNAAEDALTKGIMERQKKLTAELNALPASDQARIDELRTKLKTLTEIAIEGSPDKPQFYNPRPIPTAGTFNAAAIRGVAGGGPLDKIAKNTEETAKNTKKIAGKKNPGPVFAGAPGGQ